MAGGSSYENLKKKLWDAYISEVDFEIMRTLIAELVD